MKKISIIYSSQSGNVEVLANEIYEGAKEAGADVTIKLVHEASKEDVLSADALAFGSPSKNNNNIDQEDLAPFLKQFELTLNENKPVVLFGSYGWDNGEFMEKFKDLMNDYSFKVIGDIAVNEAPSKEELKKSRELGKLLAK
ncbi:flavodoxin short chain [Clostridium acetobutylicum]|uniref:Flavodoxin n=1 Tax=Clostridium acetobutylicum (strain ATCC 824 / DSM 792 / JCM 1419 / IAM 19013 / LMG 5710 / NBRC 13948 / NRRL B-527 / VKM B-1787 / 2291 / W) TaxID=272562 RepID=Q97GB7_CLOAB|nr:MULTISPECIES: flavodoxin [Clostridium]AAK80406.1 Flavodoxin [Clostridium acetobutylicum ATCC 824]ADZ21503.1 flavodoxin [Clostridium acetobutylicum EA 2018]AEI33980.1 flavodoxin [Clostridium acetobutylicum DSM 1731]AWV79176.1 flavodoxin [Clostridium acetobutylicum]MBC2394860.1 flavodoxin [Clostridium acetobutylicum]